MTRRYLSADQRRAAAVRTVVALAAHCDPAEITTGQIASAMEVSQGALFRHFPDKQAIWTAVLDWTSSELQARFDALRADGPMALLDVMMAAHIAFVIEHPGIPRILWGELQRSGETPAKAIVRALMARYRARVEAQLRAAQTAGEICSDADIEAGTVLFLALVQGMVMQALATDDFTALPAISRRQFALFRRSLGEKG